MSYDVFLRETETMSFLETEKQNGRNNRNSL
jgi:hypothetical protein